MAKNISLQTAKAAFLENLETLQDSLALCINGGMNDPGDAFYNEVLGLIEEAHTAPTWEELSEAVLRAKTIEIDLAAWLSRHGKTTLSLMWPKKP